MSQPRPSSALSPHGATRVELDGPHGPVAALQGPRPGDTVGSALLVPGYTGSKEDFAPLLDGIAAAGILPVAVDLPGQFESPGPHDESAYRPAELGKVVADLATSFAADGPVVLLGHSYGGHVARGAVLAGAPVAGLTLLCSGPAALPPGPRRRALDAGEVLLRQGGVDAAYAVRQQLTAALGDGSVDRAPDALSEFLRTRFVATSAACLLGMAHGLRHEPDLVDDLAAALRAGATPGLVVTGAHDDAWSVPSQQDMARRLGAEFVVVPDAAHSPNTENPAALLAALLPRWRRWIGRDAG